MFKVLAFVMLAAICNVLYGQQDTVATVTTSSVRGFPLAFYLPETGLSFGGVGIYTFRKNQDTTLLQRPSSIQVGAAYTLRNQLLLFVPYELYIDNGAYRVQGELGYYRYLYNYFGLGPTSLEADLETYDVNFPRINVQVLKQLSTRWLAGLGYAFDYFYITRIDVGGVLASESPTGIAGGAVSGPLIKLLYDSRDHLFDPHHGMFADISVVVGDATFGSNYDFRRYQIDLRKYWPLYKDHVLATRLITTYASDGAPFFQYPYVGSTNQGRGLADRRYIAQHVSTLQADLRMMLWDRLGLVVFASTSMVSDQLFGDEEVKYVPAGGLGIRYIMDKVELTRIRMDVGYSQEGLQVYFTLNEAF